MVSARVLAAITGTSLATSASARGAVDDGRTAAALTGMAAEVIQAMYGAPPSQFGHVETSDRLSGDLTVVEAAVSLRRITGKAYTFPAACRCRLTLQCGRRATFSVPVAL